MEANDWLDEILYREMPLLDRKYQMKYEMQAQKEAYCFSCRFERRMRLLLHKAAEESRKRDREPGSSKTLFRLPGRKKYLVVLLWILLMLTATIALAANIQKIVKCFHWYDDAQGTDFYNYKSDKVKSLAEINWIYPAYIPPGYQLTVEEIDEQLIYLEYENEMGKFIRYQMQVLGSCTIAFDGEYNSNETINTNGLSWFVTYRKGSYRMARVQKGDILYFARSPDDLPKEEFVRILEGIVPADRETAELNWEVDNYEEAKEILSGEQE